MLRCDVRRHHNRVMPALTECLSDTRRGLDLRNRIADDEVNAGVAVKQVKH